MSKIFRGHAAPSAGLSAIFLSFALLFALPSYCSETSGDTVASPLAPGSKDDACNTAALKCPNLSKGKSDGEEFAKKLAEKSRAEAERERTIGRCMHGVSQTIGKVCNGSDAEQLGICGNASGAGKCLRMMGFTECEFTPENRDQRQDDVQDPKHQLPGAIFVYSGGPKGDGHIEVYTGGLKWCSDHCSVLPMQSTLRKPEAIYLPPGLTPPADWKCKLNKAKS